ncbi:hypothetical protein D3C83_189910 [compost metagenome]
MGRKMKPKRRKRVKEMEGSEDLVVDNSATETITEDGSQNSPRQDKIESAERHLATPTSGE